MTHHAALGRIVPAAVVEEVPSGMECNVEGVGSAELPIARRILRPVAAWPPIPITRAFPSP
ncbi:hypothetical protein, partial [Burkholderia cepacia]|uniref:hypothetical protein n=1 Tax=Burkholderia cepacia TaxID=292 RepID=UPI002ABE6CFF